MSDLYGGEALKSMLSSIEVDKQIEETKNAIREAKNASVRDPLVKKLKYLAGLKKNNFKTASDAYIIHSMPVLPPVMRPYSVKGSNRVEYADINKLYKDHMLVNQGLKEVKDDLPADMLIKERTDAYNGARAIIGTGDPITQDSAGKGLKGILRQVAGVSGPKSGYFHDKILKKKQDFSGRATIYAEPSLDFNEAGIPIDMIWNTYKLHIVRDLVNHGYNYLDAEKAWKDRNPAATASMNKLIKKVPIILNRAPTLMRSNLTAFYPVPIPGKTMGINPLMLTLFAGDFDGDALSSYVPMTQEAIEEAKKNLLPINQIHDYRRGFGHIMTAPGHEAVLGSMHLTEPDHEQKVVEFNSENEVLEALKQGKVKENTPIRIKKGPK